MWSCKHCETDLAPGPDRDTVVKEFNRVCPHCGEDLRKGDVKSRKLELVGRSKMAHRWAKGRLELLGGGK